MIKKQLHILWLKYLIFSLQEKRKNAILNISIKQSKTAARVESLESIKQQYFEEIDEKITSTKRLIEILSK